MMTLSTTLAGVHFPSCLMNAAGAWSATHEGRHTLAASATGPAFDIIVGGGVSTSKDAQAALDLGAKAVHIGSAFVKEGPGVYARLQEELLAAQPSR